jgi:radical SAM superfamily enzyme YgiQ (UPF0313 family)
MGIRTVAGFLLGFPHDTRQSIRDVGHYACTVGPTYANFNVVTPYPGTEFAEQIKDQIADFDYSRYTTFTPVLKYEHLTAEQVAELHHWCARRFYFRWEYLRQNAHLLWPWLQKLGLGRERSGAGGDKETPTGPHHAVQDTLSPKGLRQDKPHQS